MEDLKLAAQKAAAANAAVGSLSSLSSLSSSAGSADGDADGDVCHHRVVKLRPDVTYRFRLCATNAVSE